MEYILIFGLSILVTAGLALWDGFVLMKLWAWFIVPLFHLPALTIAAAIGLGLIASFLTHQMRPDNEENPLAAMANIFGYGFVNAGMCLLIGWVVTFFM